MKKIEVWADWHFLDGVRRVGTLSVSDGRGKEVFFFEYDKDWIQSDNSYQVDPQLSLYPGRFSPTMSSPNFGIFLDSSPDRWGRTLMVRREAIRASDEGREARKLFESDYLLAVADKTRMGGLRFKVDGTFLDDDVCNPTPPWTSIRELEHAAKTIEEDQDDEAVKKELRQLFAPGSSLGGARPKANILDQEGGLWIAKFPSQKDERNVGAWEMVAHTLARKCGIQVPEAKAKKFASDHDTFLVKRFDRVGESRIHFASVMTLLEHKDGAGSDSGVSYLEIVDLIIRSGQPSTVDEDLKGLWTRIVFSIAVSNTDDHLRNHGFLLTSNEGLRLSPAYDINPNVSGMGLSLNISQDSNALDFELAKSVAHYFRISAKDADQIIDQVRTEVSRWNEVAESLGISTQERRRMARAFRVK